MIGPWCFCELTCTVQGYRVPPNCVPYDSGWFTRFANPVVKGIMGFMETQDVAKRRRLVRASKGVRDESSAFKLDPPIGWGIYRVFSRALPETNSQFALENGWVFVDDPASFWECFRCELLVFRKGNSDQRPGWLGYRGDEILPSHTGYINSII